MSANANIHLLHCHTYDVFHSSCKVAQQVLLSLLSLQHRAFVSVTMEDRAGHGAEVDGHTKKVHEHTNEVDGPKTDHRLCGMRRNVFFAVLIVLTIGVVALAVGLEVGLTRELVQPYPRGTCLDELTSVATDTNPKRLQL